MWSFNQGDNNQNSNVGWNMNNANPAGGAKVRIRQHMFSYQLISSRWLRQQQSGLRMELGRSISCSANANASAAPAVALQRKISALKRLRWLGCRRRSVHIQRRWCRKFCTLHCQMGELYTFIVFRLPMIHSCARARCCFETLLSSLSAQTQAQSPHRRAAKFPSDSCTRTMPAPFKPCTLLSRVSLPKVLTRKTQNIFIISHRFSAEISRTSMFGLDSAAVWKDFLIGLLCNRSRQLVLLLLFGVFWVSLAGFVSRVWNILKWLCA